MPPQQINERIVCSVTAAVKYDVPANIVLAIAEKEAGKPGRWVKNTNESYDVGWMQFNTNYLKELKQYGITAKDVAASGCYSFDLAAWRLHHHIKNDKGDIWTKAANYHSKTPCYNARYRSDLIKKAVKWADWLEALFKKNANQTVLSPTPQTKEYQKLNTNVSQPEKPYSNAVLQTSYVSRKIMINARKE